MAISFQSHEVLPSDIKLPTSYDEAVALGYPIVAAKALAILDQEDYRDPQLQLTHLEQRRQCIQDPEKLPNFTNGITEDQISKLVSYAGAFAMINGLKAGLPLDEEGGRIYSAAIDSVGYAIGSRKKTLWDVENQIQLGIKNIKQSRLEKKESKGSGKLIEVDGAIKVAEIDLDHGQKSALFNAYRIESTTRAREIKQELKNALSSARREIGSLNDVSPKSLTDDKVILILALAGLIDLSGVPQGKTEELSEQTIKIVATNWKYSRGDCAEKEGVSDIVVMRAIKEATLATGARTNNAMRLMLVKDRRIPADEVDYIG